MRPMLVSFDFLLFGEWNLLISSFFTVVGKHAKAFKSFFFFLFAGTDFLNLSKVLLECLPTGVQNVFKKSLLISVVIIGSKQAN